jgi:hypothetical protein
MAIRSLKTGQFSRSTLVGNPVIMPGSYESIATVSVGAGGASSVTFSSIPSTYSHLQIRAIAKSSSTGTYWFMRFNSDTATNYSVHELYGTGTSALAYGAANTTSVEIYYSIETSTASNVFAASVIDILDYGNTNKFKTVRKLGGTENNSAGGIDISSGAWRSTNAITSISFTPNTGNFAQYSYFALYGVN